MPHMQPIMKALKVHGRSSNRQLAGYLEWRKPKTSRDVKQLTAEGRLVVGRYGREKVIALARQFISPAGSLCRAFLRRGWIGTTATAFGKDILDSALTAALLSDRLAPATQDRL